MASETIKEDTIESPTKEEIRTLRRRLHITQEEAGAMVHVTRRCWQAWEGGINTMSAGYWDLFQRKAKEVAVEKGIKL